jgi:hypothetical protein
MTTTDANGIVFYETTDPVSPLQTLLNLGQTSVTNALNTRGKLTKNPSGTAPTGPVDGDLWWKTDSKLLAVYDATAGYWKSISGSVSGNVSVPAFITGASSLTLIAGAALSHPFTGAVTVDAILNGDCVVGANTSVKFNIAIGSVNRYGWVQNFGPGNLRDSPNATVTATVSPGTTPLLYVSLSDNGPGGTSGTLGQLMVDYVIRPA